MKATKWRDDVERRAELAAEGRQGADRRRCSTCGFQLSMGVAKNPARRRAGPAAIWPGSKTILRERAAGHPADGVEAGMATVGEQKTREGVVVSDKMTKTRVVRDRARVPPSALRARRSRGRSGSRRTTRPNASKVGDRVLIEETRPLSKDKRWRIREILERAPEPETRHDPAALHARRRRQLRAPRRSSASGSWAAPTSATPRSGDSDRRRQGGGAGRHREEGRGGAGGGGAHGQGGGAPRRLLHPLRPQRGGAAQGRRQPGGHAHLRARWRASCGTSSSPRSSRWRPRSSEDASWRSRTCGRATRSMVIAGKERGKRGKVLRVLPEKGRVVVEHINMIKKHQRPDAEAPAGRHHRARGVAPPLQRDAGLRPAATSRPATACKALADGKKVAGRQRCGEIDRQGVRTMAEQKKADKPAGRRPPAARQGRPGQAAGAAGRRQGRPAAATPAPAPSAPSVSGRGPAADARALPGARWCPRS